MKQVFFNDVSNKSEIYKTHFQCYPKKVEIKWIVRNFDFGSPKNFVRWQYLNFLECSHFQHRVRTAKITRPKDVMQGKLFQKCTHLSYCSVLSLGGNVNTRRMSKPHMGSIFHIKKSMKYSGYRKLLCELSKLSKFNAFNLLGY